MASPREQSLIIWPLGPAWFVTCVLLGAALVLPGLTWGSLLCNHCPVQHKRAACPNVTTQCPPDQRCSSSQWRYGAVHVLSAQGCVSAHLCGTHQDLTYRDVTYNVSHTCCCEDRCNQAPEPENYLKKLLGWTKAKLDPTHLGNSTNGTVKEPWDSCANYTSPIAS